MKKIILLLLAPFILFTSCSDKSTTDYYVIDFAKAAKKGEVPLLSSVASDVNYIVLETSEESMLDMHTNLKFNNSQFIVESNQTKGFVIFDKDGNFVRKVNRNGNGPEEYKVFFSSAIEDENKGVIAVQQQKQINRYTNEGDFLGNITFKNDSPMFYRNLEYCGDGIYKMEAESENKYNIILMDSTGKIIRSNYLCDHFTQFFPDMGISISIPPVVTMNDDSFIFINVSSDTLFKFDRDFNKSIYGVIDTGNYHALVGADDYLTKIIFGESLLLETENFILMGVGCPKQHFSHLSTVETEKVALHVNIFYNKKTGETFVPKVDNHFRVSGFKNDIDNGPVFEPKYLYNNKLYTLIDAIDFIDYAEICDSQKIKDIASRLSEESNPVLMEVTLK